MVDHIESPRPRVILGCGTFGGIGGALQLVGMGLNRQSALATLDEAAALGIDFWDTAESYAGGESELAIGAWLATRPGPIAAQIRLATKTAPPKEADHLFDSQYVQRKLDGSLARLGLERVDLMMAHAICPRTPIETMVEAFGAVVESGKAGQVGCCNVGPETLIAALETARRMNLPGFTWVQNGFSLLAPLADAEVRAICRERGLTYCAYSPLAGGVLSGKYRRGEPFPPDTRMALRPDGLVLSERTHDALDTLRAMANARNVESAVLALAWVLSHPDFIAPVVGPSRYAPHLAHVAKSMEIELTQVEREQLSSAFATIEE
jgi:aryl-alcohol dehydrogenase-like predicted oxidoreductase